MAEPLVPGVAGLCYGGDYNPEQWPEEVWTEDIALMREAGVNLVSVGIFAWSLLEPRPHEYDFGALDRVLDLLHGGGIRVDLATATASPPAWFSLAHPESLPVDADGRTLTYGSRQAYCPSSPAYRAAALRLVDALARRYRDHPALAMWHVNNEYGCHVPRCYCDASAEAFRRWLRSRYCGDLAALNAAWGTAFWSQRLTAWDQVLPPRATPTFANPTQVLDFRRFCSAELLSLFIAERDLLHRLTPDVPVTTNLMPSFVEADYWRWAPELSGPRRLLASDHYLVAADPIEPPAQIAFAADLSRSLARGPWLLMEHSTSAVNWQPRNRAKRPGQLARDSLGHVARGSDGALFFQWRASRAGAEKWHSGMVPHGGTDTKVWREVVELGGHLRRLAGIAGSTVECEVAILHDYVSAWAQEAPSQPSVDMSAFAEVRRWHAALWRAHVTADIAHPGADLSRYRVVLAPALYLLGDAEAANLAGYVAAGGTLVVGPYSGVVDENDQVRLGGYPGALTELLGVRVEEFFPLAQDEVVRLTDGTVGRVWTELGRATTATVLASYVDGPVAGSPALTRQEVGGGAAWYVGTRLDDRSLGSLVDRLGLGGPFRGSTVEAVRRRGPDGSSYLFLFNHGDHRVRVAARGIDLLTGTAWPDATSVDAGAVVVLREEAA